MRFQDWDVLLFPAASHVPIPEFRTACFAQHDGRGASTPLLTCFVPALDEGAPFQVSVHSWSRPSAITDPHAAHAAHVGESTALATGPATDYVWRVKMAVDGAAVVAETYPEVTPWPRQIETASGLGPPSRLPFPRFHRSILSQTHWNAADDTGRIKVQVSAGYTVEQDGTPQFVKVFDHVVFSFQPAPIEILERSGIAWPNANLPVVNNPLLASDARHVSVGALPMLDEASSRSTSAYSTYSPAVYPPMHLPNPVTGSYAAGYAHGIGGHDRSIRLPSDQLQTIINAMSPPPQPLADTSMLPPPLPQRLGLPTPPTLPNDRRGESRYSDVSMHAACTAFPSCLTEDSDGHLLHADSALTTTSPAPAIKGRKEGVSTPAKPRDFLSTVLDSSPAHPAAAATSPLTATVASSPAAGVGGAEGSARKRTRSALRSLTLHDGSPERRERVREKTKPPRKVSRASTRGSDKENEMVE